MAIKSFEDLTVWQDSQELCRSIFVCFKSTKEFGFRDQIFRASVSISNNIAEGYERQSTKEYIRFLFIAKGSCGEVRSMTYLARDFNFIDQRKFEQLNELAKKISSKLINLISKLSQS